MARIYQSRTLRSTLRDMDRQIRRQGSASVLARSGLSVPEEGVTQVDGTLHVLGDFIADGKVSNEALENPLRVDCLYTSASGFGVTTTGTAPLASQTWQTPAGYTTCVVHITSRVFAYNPTAGLDYLQGRSRVSVPSRGYTFFGAALPVAVSGGNGSGTSSSPLAVRVEDLVEGDDIVIDVQGWSQFANWAANAGNTADIAGILLWTR